MVRFQDDTDGTYEGFPSNHCAYLYHPRISDKEEGHLYLVRADNPTDDQELDLAANRQLWKIESREGYRLIKHVDTDKYLRIHPVSYEVGDHNHGSCKPDRNDRGRLSSVNGFVHLVDEPDEHCRFSIHKRGDDGYYNLRHLKTRSTMEADPKVELCNVHPGRLRADLGGWSSNAFRRGSSNLTRGYDWGRWDLQPADCPSPPPGTNPSPSPSPNPSPSPSPSPSPNPSPNEDDSLFWNPMKSAFWDVENYAIWIYVGSLVVALIGIAILVYTLLGKKSDDT